MLASCGCCCWGSMRGLSLLDKKTQCQQRLLEEAATWDQAMPAATTPPDALFGTNRVGPQVAHFTDMLARNAGNASLAAQIAQRLKDVKVRALHAEGPPPSLSCTATCVR